MMLTQTCKAAKEAEPPNMLEAESPKPATKKARRAPTEAQPPDTLEAESPDPLKASPRGAKRPRKTQIWSTKTTRPQAKAITL